MNQKCNQRFIENEKKIEQSFFILLQKKESSQITVKEICELSSINRSTFYHHYQDIPDLMTKVEHRLQTELLSVLRAASGGFQNLRSYFCLDYLTLLIEHIEKYAVFYRAYLQRNPDEIMDESFSLLWDNFYKPNFLQYGVTQENHMLYYYHFFKAGFLQTIKLWLINGCPESPQELSDIIWNYAIHLVIEKK